jgi:hypothetical protein
MVVPPFLLQLIVKKLNRNRDQYHAKRRLHGWVVAQPVPDAVVFVASAVSNAVVRCGCFGLLSSIAGRGYFILREEFLVVLMPKVK